MVPLFLNKENSKKTYINEKLTFVKAEFLIRFPVKLFNKFPVFTGERFIN